MPVFDAYNHCFLTAHCETIALGVIKIDSALYLLLNANAWRKYNLWHLILVSAVNCISYSCLVMCLKAQRKLNPDVHFHTNCYTFSYVKSYTTNATNSYPEGDKQNWSQQEALCIYSDKQNTLCDLSGCCIPPSLNAQNGKKWLNLSCAF